MCNGCTTLYLQSATNGWIFEGFADEEKVDGCICVSAWTGDDGCTSLHVGCEVNKYLCAEVMLNLIVCK